MYQGGTVTMNTTPELLFPAALETLAADGVDSVRFLSELVPAPASTGTAGGGAGAAAAPSTPRRTPSRNNPQRSARPKAEDAKGSDAEAAEPAKA